ncbi:hypothetical protein [Hydrogenophaga sp.]|uniref:hypothetical protein n=1 Tax=Hydrogenophaga sp. TaxID=1904254 RepID=UPI00260ACCC0|nr:hypothetical protein [Hydrogenophaga sp.]MDM7948373.1 hypothetical protein [Hydrogenophaga sp.]
MFELELDELFEPEFEELLELEFEELFEELLELEFEELFEERLELEFEELFDERFELELLELLELRLLELFTLELEEPRVPAPAPSRPRRSLSSPMLRAAEVRPRSQALKKPCTGVRARRSSLASSACAAVTLSAPTIAAVTKAVCFVFMLYLSCVDRQKMECA